MPVTWFTKYAILKRIAILLFLLLSISLYEINKMNTSAYLVKSISPFRAIN